MPELPEVETTRRTLAPHLVGATIARARLLRSDVLERDAGRRASVASRLLEGGRIEELHRHGKNLAIIAADGRALGVHLGMTGSLEWSAELPRRKHVHAAWELAGGGGFVSFEDPRRFGGLCAFPTFEALREERWRDLGPDALGISAPVLMARLRTTGRGLKAALLDQRVVAGLGNIYVDEALFIAGLHPLAPASAVSSEQGTTLASAIRRVLRDALAAGGSTLRDYRNAEGEAGSFQLQHAVYGRAGEPCIRCGSPLNSQRITQRMSVWCPFCQPPIEGTYPHRRRRQGTT